MRNLLIVGALGMAVAFAAELPVAPLGVYKSLERGYWAFQPRKR